MPAPTYEQQQRAYHLKRLDRFLNRMGTFGTELVEPASPGGATVEERQRTWTGLLIWSSAESPCSGIVVRCEPGSETGAWRYTYGDGAVIAGVFDQLKVVQELTGVLLPGPPDLLPPAG